jgi:hypothetical protein
MTPDERSTDGGNRRGGRGQSRGGGTPDPRIVSRRPARSKAAEADTEQAPEQKPASPKRAAAARATRATKPDTPASEQPAEAAQQAETPAPAEPENGATAGGTRRRRRRSDATPAAEAVAEAGSSETPPDDGSVTAVLRSVREALDDLNGRVARMERQQRLGVFVDVPNLIYGAERSDEPIHMGKLLDLLSVSDDPAEPVERQKFVAPFVPFEYRIVTKPLKRFADGSIKGNFDVEMAVDMVTMAERLDVICIVSGDADFARVVEVIQSRGVRVEVAAFANSTAAEMRAIADHYVELGSIVETLR